MKTCDTPCAIASLHIRRRLAHFESGARTSHKWLRLNFVKSNFAGWARGGGGRVGTEWGGRTATQGPHLRRQSLSIPLSLSLWPESRTSPHMLGQDRKRYGLFGSSSGGQREREKRVAKKGLPSKWSFDACLLDPHSRMNVYTFDECIIYVCSSFMATIHDVFG